MDWNQLDSGWQSAFHAAWEAYLKNTIPIGAVIQNEKGIVVSVGRNRIHDQTGTPPQLFNHKLAHAEINCILQLKETEHPQIRNYILTTTMEPCPLCFGAVAMSSIRHLRFAARDRYAGATVFNRYSEYVKNKNIQIEGPVKGLEIIQIAIQTDYELENHNNNCEPILKQWSKDCPPGVNLGRQLYCGHTLQILRQNGIEASAVFNKISKMLP